MERKEARAGVDKVVHPAMVPPALQKISDAIDAMRGRRTIV